MSCRSPSSSRTNGSIWKLPRSGWWPIGKGRAGVPAADVGMLVCAALEQPRDYPPLRQAVVPGDRVVVAADHQIPALGPVLAAVCDTLMSAGVEASAITVLFAAELTGKAADDVAGALPVGVARAVHDPDDRNELAYLATTTTDRRVYLNRLLTDADVVVPVGRLGFDSVLGYRGPWGLIFPGLSDQATAAAYRSLAVDDWPDADRPRPPLAESDEVSWLLGTQFHLGILPGAETPVTAVAGLESVVRSEGARLVDAAWTCEAESRAEVVVIGIGQPHRPSTIDDLANGLANAVRLVERGGKIVVLSRLAGPIGPAFQRLHRAR